MKIPKDEIRALAQINLPTFYKLTSVRRDYGCNQPGFLPDDFEIVFEYEVHLCCRVRAKPDAMHKSNSATIATPSSRPRRAIQIVQSLIAQSVVKKAVP